MNHAVIDREEIPMFFIPNVKQTIFAEKSLQKRVCPLYSYSIL